MHIGNVASLSYVSAENPGPFEGQDPIVILIITNSEEFSLLKNYSEISVVLGLMFVRDR